MDNNDQLKQAIQEILALEWPVVTQASTPKPSIHDGTVWISTLRFFERLAPQALKEIRHQDETQREDLFAFSFEDMSAEEKSEAIAQSKAITQATQRARTELASPVLEAIQAINLKTRTAATMLFKIVRTIQATTTIMK